MSTERDLVRVSLEVNGHKHRLALPAKETLLETLRERLSLRGTKNGCGEGICGSCTVLVDGRARRACVARTTELSGAKITTIEGLAPGGQLHPLQEAFIQEGAVGCGFCTPGMLMVALALLRADPSPSEGRIKRALQPNLCRCLGYWPILRAIQRAAGQKVQRRCRAQGRTGSLRLIGCSVPRIDAVEKVTGQAVFADDLVVPDMLCAATVRSTCPHARLLDIDASAALGLPGVVAVLTARDIPGENSFGKTVADQPILADDLISYYGQPVALVAANSMELARAAAEKVVVTCELLPPVLMEDTFEAGKPEHVLHHIHISQGDIRAGFERAAVTVEETFRTQRTDPLFLEPPAGVAQVDPQGHLLLHTACQHPYGVQRQIARALAIDEDRVRLLQTTCGGAFGGKVEASVQIHLALLAWRLRCSVKMVYTRAETFLSAVKRHPMLMKYRAAADSRGRLTAMQVTLLADTGAFETSGKAVLFNACHQATGPYRLPNVEVDGYLLRTNTIPSGAQRGFGVPQVAFAHESIMDMLAIELGLGPEEIRQRNLLVSGCRLAGGQRLNGAVPAGDTFRAVCADRPGRLRECFHGTGVAVGLKSVGYSGGVENVARAEVRVGPDGRVAIRTGGLEMGQGAVTILAQIAAEELELEVGQVEVVPIDTSDQLDSGSTEASRLTLSTGQALLQALGCLKGMILGEAADFLATEAWQLSLASGEVRVRGTDRAVSLAELSRHLAAKGRCLEARGQVAFSVPGRSRGPDGEPVFAVDLSFCAARAEVAVDPETGKPRVLSVTLAQDVGRALNPLNVQAQMESGVVMGLGFAQTEEFALEGGVPSSVKLGSYRVPRCRDLPAIRSVLIEQPGEVGPYGAKGIGELPVIPVAAAVANAIYDAVGFRVTELPIARSRLRAFMERKAAREARGD